MLIWILVATAVAFVLWPSKTVEEPFGKAFGNAALTPAPKPAAPGYMAALSALHDVRSRLAATGNLTDAAQKSLDSLTLLVMSEGGK